MEKKNCLQKRICHKLAPSNDFTIGPPKLKHTAPKKTRIGPGIFLLDSFYNLNIVNNFSNVLLIIFI